MQWISVTEKLPEGPGEIVKAKRKNGMETSVYYHKDKMAWLHGYCKFPWTHFQDEKTLVWLEDVTHWMPLSRDSQE